MKKLYLLLFVFILQASLSFAGSILDYYPAQTLGSWCFDSKWASKLLGYTGKNNELSKAYQEAVKCLKERASIDIENDITKIGIFLVPGGGSFTSVAVFSGKFNTNNNVSLIEKALKSSNSEGKIENITVNGKSVKSFNDGRESIIFYDDSAVLFCYNTALDELKNNGVTFTKAPDEVAELFKRSNSFIYISKAIVPILGMLRVPPQLVSGVVSLSSYVDKEDNIRIEITFNDSNMAKQIHDGLKNLIDIYKGYYAGEFEKNKRSLKDNNSVANMSETIFSMYTGAKAKDLVDSLKFSVSNNTVVISTEFEAFKIISGVLGGILNVVMKSPQFVNARSNAREKACFSNQRVLQGAVEMYNMDNSVMMTTLDVEALIKGKYLRSAPSGPEPDCQYYSVGNLTGDGYISCKKHGSPFDPQNQHHHPHPHHR